MSFDSIKNNFEKMVTNVADRYRSNKLSSQPTALHIPTHDLSMTSTRGMLFPQVALNSEESLIQHAFIFQFNPEEIRYSKGINYTQHQRLGYAYDIPFWIHSGAKTIQFRLMLDGTAGSNHKNMIMREARGFNNNNNANSAYYSNEEYETALEQQNRGLVDKIAKLEAMIYPMTKNGTDLVKHSFGFVDVSQLKQFDNPPYILFSYGDVAANVFITGMERNDVLFNKVLNPIRTEIDLTLTVIEAKVLNKQFVANRTPVTTAAGNPLVGR